MESWGGPGDISSIVCYLFLFFGFFFFSNEHFLWPISLMRLSTTSVRTLISQPWHSSACRHSAYRRTPRYQGSDLTSCSLRPHRPTTFAVSVNQCIEANFLIPPLLSDFFFFKSIFTTCNEPRWLHILKGNCQYINGNQRRFYETTILQ